MPSLAAGYSVNPVTVLGCSCVTGKGTGGL